MEPITATTIAALAFTKAFEKTVEKFTETALKKIDDLRKKIFDKFRGNNKVEPALEAAEKGSKEDLETVADYLKILMREEPEFAEELQKLAREIKAGQKQEDKSMTQINQDNAKGWQTQISGGTNFIGENTVHQTPGNS